MGTDFLVFEESPFTPAQLEKKLNRKMADLKIFCSLRVDRYWKTSNSWYDTAMLEGKADPKYYAVFTSNRECPGERAVASKVLAFISSDDVLRAKIFDPQRNPITFLMRRAPNYHQMCGSTSVGKRLIVVWSTKNSINGLIIN